jgi:hypothetical protein
MVSFPSLRQSWTERIVNHFATRLKYFTTKPFTMSTIWINICYPVNKKGRGTYYFQLGGSTRLVL